MTTESPSSTDRMQPSTATLRTMVSPFESSMHTRSSTTNELKQKMRSSLGRSSSVCMAAM